MRTFLAHQLAQQHPERDPHPLAREDGGWYPGKHFDPTDILTDPRNWTVWKQFLMFFFGILCVPVLSFVGVEWILRVIGGLKFQQSQTIGAVVAILVLQVFMISYARRAVIEETLDYAQEQADKAQRTNRQDADEATESLITAHPVPTKDDTAPDADTIAPDANTVTQDADTVAQDADTVAQDADTVAQDADTTNPEEQAGGVPQAAVEGQSEEAGGSATTELMPEKQDSKTGQLKHRG